MKPHISQPLAAILLAAATLPAAAQTVDIGEVLITPNREAADRAKVGSKVEEIGKEEIEQTAKPLVVDHLTLLPGVSVSPPGGRGQETTLIVRGADKKYVKTLYNGIDISDPTATQVQTPFEHLLAGGVDRIEVLKGSQSTLYGSDAVAGVIGISTLGEVDPGLHHELAVEGGSFMTARAGYGLTGASETGKAAFHINGLTTDGISSADKNLGATEDDGYRNVTASFAGEQALGEGFSVFGAGLLIDSDAEFDDAGFPPSDNPFNDTQALQLAGRAGANADFLDGRLRNTVSAQIFDIDRDLHLVSMFGPYDANYHGRRTKLDYQGAYDATGWLTLQFGADHERQSAEVGDNFGTDTSDDFTLNGVWTQAVFEPLDDLTVAAGLRYDDHSAFGGHMTYRVTGAYRLPEHGTKLHASFGTGYRAPSLYELYAPFGIGNPDLSPEESVSFDVGVEQVFLGGALVGDVTWFQLNTDDLIDYSYSSFRYEQFEGVTRRSGVEASLHWSPTPWLDLGAAYTYTQARQADGVRRPRVPRHDVAVVATARPAEGWEATATLRAVSDVVDLVSPSFATFETVPLDDYVLLDAKLSYRVSETAELYVRGENLLDQDYQVVKGFGMPGLAVYAGLRARF